MEQCGIELHRSVCPLEPVACEMKEFGCSVMVSRKELATQMRELATQMREGEFQHLTAMTAFNLRLTKQLQLDSIKRDRKLKQLQQEVVELKIQGKMQNEVLAEVKADIQRVHCISEHIECHTAVCTS